MWLASKVVGTLARELSGRGLGKYATLNKVYAAVFRRLAPKIAESATVHGMTIHLPVPGSNTARMIAFTGEWEPVETRLFRKHVRPGMIVADCGANVGYYTLLASKLVKEYGNVVSFEPSPAIYDMLLRNIYENKLVNVTPHSVALLHKHKPVILHIDESRTGYDSIVGLETQESVIVQGKPLDYYFGDKRPVDFIKMDIQGAEHLALQGMTQTIRNNPNLRMMVEYSPGWILRAKGNPDDFLYHLGLDFDIQVIHKSGLRPLFSVPISNHTVNLFCERKA